MIPRRRKFALVALIASCLVASGGRAAAQASAPGGSRAISPSTDLSVIRAMAVDALQSAARGDLSQARVRVEALEVQWRGAKSTMTSLSPQRRQAIDTAIDRAERELRFSRAQVNIVCPWHGYEYDLRTGCHQGNAAVRLKAYKVSVRDGAVYVDI